MRGAQTKLIRQDTVPGKAEAGHGSGGGALRIFLKAESVIKGRWTKKG